MLIYIYIYIYIYIARHGACKSSAGQRFEHVTDITDSSTKRTAYRHSSEGRSSSTALDILEQALCPIWWCLSTWEAHVSISIDLGRASILTSSITTISFVRGCAPRRRAGLLTKDFNTVLALAPSSGRTKVPSMSNGRSTRCSACSVKCKQILRSMKTPC